MGVSCGSTMTVLVRFNFMLEIPKWWPTLFAVAEHQDRKQSWPWYGRLQHYLFVSFRCPCCIEANEDLISVLKKFIK